MKRIIIALASIATLSACTSREEIISGLTDNPTQKTDSVFTYTMTMNDDAKPSDAEVGTRVSSSGVWEDNDTIQIFFGGVNSAYAQGVYHLSSNSWTVTSAKSLQETNSSICSIAYYKGVGMTQTDDGWRHYDYMTDWYSTEEGQYSISNGSILVSATLKRPYWRLRFKGEPGTVIKVDSTGIMRVAASKKLSADYKSSFFVISVNSDGFTNYFIGTTDVECSSLKIIDIRDDYCYVRYFDDHILEAGESASITIPSPIQANGWSRSQDYDFVDLGLPSGTLWATRNIGAIDETEMGWLFAWGETEQKETYTTDNYKFFSKFAYESSYYNATKYNDIDGLSILEDIDDAACCIWGASWHIPTDANFEELFEQCSRLGKSGNSYILRSKINGRTLVLPLCNFWTSKGVCESAGYSTIYGSYFNDYYDSAISWRYDDSEDRKKRHNGIAIRPITIKID